MNDEVGAEPQGPLRPPAMWELGQEGSLLVTLIIDEGPRATARWVGKATFETSSLLLVILMAAFEIHIKSDFPCV